MSPSQSLFALLFLSACALAYPTPAGLLKVDAITNLGVTAAICEALDTTLLSTRLVQKACVAAGLTVGTNTSAAVAAPASKDLYTSAFVGAMAQCNSLFGQLSSTLSNANSMATSTSATLSSKVIVRTLLLVSADLNGAVVTAKDVQHTTEVQVETSVYQGYVTFASALQGVLVQISNLPTLYAEVDARVSVHATLLQLQATLNDYSAKLFTYISADLDKTSRQASLSASLDAAIQATA